jgi:predicted cation transporter
VDRPGARQPERRAALSWRDLLTAINDNALITFLATLVPNFSDELKIAVVEGAVTGGGLTVIANAPNPAGQAILGRFFDNAVAPLYLFLGALTPTAIAALAYRFL